MRWVRYSALNLVEHGITRGADILITLAIVWGFPTQKFSVLATSQAIVAPMLFFFPPVHILYREFAAWKGKSADALAGNLWVLRKFGWGLGQLALVLSLLLALVMPIGENFPQRFWALLWGFSLTVGINIFAPDRELLRLELKMRALNGVTIYQKTTALLGTLAAIYFFPGRIDILALVVLGSVVTTAWISHALVTRVLHESGASDAAIHGRDAPPLIPTLRDMFARFSLWNHFCGVIWNWVQTMDLFFLGIFRIPALQLGFYAVGLKVANLALAAPMALANVFAVWVGRRPNGDSEMTTVGFHEERGRLKRYSLLLFAGSAVQAIVLYLVAPMGIQLLSHGRWNLEEQSQILGWLVWLLVGSTLFGSTFLFFWWLMLRADVLLLLKRVYVPLLIGSVAIFGLAAYLKGPDGAARANVAVGLFYVFLIGIFFNRSMRQPVRQSPSKL